jgi:hypothetical protein
MFKSVNKEKTIRLICGLLPVVNTRHIIDSFPRNPNRTVLLHYGIHIPLMASIPKARWNYLSADWESFAQDIDQVVQFIPYCMVFNHH